ncbi:MAG: nucleotidyl transferase AbiEii/AbiGii toxin family protein [Jiangellaceae bacterium]
MNAVEAGLRRLASDLIGSGRAWALVGGFAVSARAEPRFTRDVDVAVAVPDDASAEALVRSLIAGGYRLLASIEQDVAGRLATVRLNCPVTDDEDVVVDLLFASSGIEPDIVNAAERVEIVPGLVLPVAATGHLIALKLLARDDEARPQDLADLRALHAVAGPGDLALAREAVTLISSRGYARGRDLAAALDALVGR